MDYDVIIIGAGPGGIFSAYELTRLRPDMKIAIFEAGNTLEKRNFPVSKIKLLASARSAGFPRIS